MVHGLVREQVVLLISVDLKFNRQTYACRGSTDIELPRNLKLAAYEQDLFFFWGTPHISFFTWISIRHFPRCKCKQNSFSRHCNARLSAVKVWDIIENRACAAVVHGFSNLRTTFECIYTNAFTSKVSRGLNKSIPKPLGQDKPRLELALGWISREHIFCTIYTGCSRLM